MTQAWESVRLEQVLKLKIDAVEISPMESYKISGVYSFGRGLLSRAPIKGSETTYKVFHRLHENDFILSQLKAWEGALARVTAEHDGWFLSPQFPTFRAVPELLDIRYLEWFCKFSPTWDLLKGTSRGIGARRESVSPKSFLGISIPLPPLEEQRRIVARVESLAAQIAEARGLREQAIQERELTYYTALKKMRENLLEQHETKALGTVTKVTAGGTPSRENPTYWGGKIPWIKTGELFDSDIFDSEEHITQQGLEGSSAKLFPPETILIALYGQGQTRGRTGRLMLEASTNQACCAVLPSPDILESRFTQFWLQSLYKDMREQSQGGAQPNWNAGMIKDVLIVLPSLQIQQEILTKVDDFKSQISSLEQLQEATRLELNALLPSVLSKAFAGEL